MEQVKRRTSLPSEIAKRKLVKKTIAENFLEFFSTEGITGISALRTGNKRIDYVIHISLKSKEYLNNIPDFFDVTDEKGRRKRIKIKTTISGLVKTHSIEIGGTIYNKFTPSNLGTLSTFAIDKISKEKVFLSCYHVLRNQHPWDGFVEMNQEEIVSFTNNESITIGKLSYGLRNETFDIGIATLIDVSMIHIPEEYAINKSKKVTEEDEHTPVFIKARSSDNMITGFISDDSAHVKIDYSDGTNQLFIDLIKISKDLSNKSKAPTFLGDSGALVFNNDKEAIGIIVGADDNYSYAMHFTKIEDTFNLKISNT
jgi:hypothetical protein